MKKNTLLLFLFMAIISYGQTAVTTNIVNLNFQSGAHDYTNNGAHDGGTLTANNWTANYNNAAARVTAFGTIVDPHDAGNTILSITRGTANAAGGTTGIRLESESLGGGNFAPEPNTVVADGNPYILRVKMKVRASNDAIGAALGAQVRLNTGTNIIGTFSGVGSVSNTSTAGWTEIVMDVTIPNTTQRRFVDFRLLMGDTILTKLETYHFDDISVEMINPEGFWKGTTDNDWDTTTNWESGAVPGSTADVLIEKGLSNYPTASSAVTVNSVSMAPGTSLIANSTFTGTINYNVEVQDTNWHLISSPVVGEQYDDAWVTANSIASGANNNKGIGTYDNGTADTDTDGAGTDTATGHWRYFQGGTSLNFDSSVGYSLIRTASDNYTFTGTFPTADVTPAISQDDNNWNMVGNPYPSYLNVATFISTNTANLSAGFQSIYVWNAGTSSYDPMTTGHIHPGQAFFVNSNVASGNASITEAMQSHQTGITFYKNATPSIKLFLSNGASTKNTQINYLGNKTQGLDPGFDIGMFNGVSSDISIYTNLIDNNEGISFARQALPNYNLESMIVPVGLKSAAGKDIIFTAEALNLPQDIKVFLEDRHTKIFTRLDEVNASYKITLEEALNGVGRFFLHTKSSTLNVASEILNSVSIYKTSNSNLRISGLQNGKAKVSLFNLLGKQVMKTSIDASNTNNISLPKLATGVYIVKLQTEKGKLNKKIILE